jgi:hypothetical protein
VFDKTTFAVVQRFIMAFHEHDPQAFVDRESNACVMETIQLGSNFSDHSRPSHAVALQWANFSGFVVPQHDDVNLARSVHTDRQGQLDICGPARSGNERDRRVLRESSFCQ